MSRRELRGEESHLAGQFAILTLEAVDQRDQLHDAGCPLRNTLGTIDSTLRNPPIFCRHNP
jgi:hypothetical protein